jgi:hypothetical protein
MRLTGWGVVLLAQVRVGRSSGPRLTHLYGLKAALFVFMVRTRHENGATQCAEAPSAAPAGAHSGSLRMRATGAGSDSPPRSSVANDEVASARLLRSSASGGVAAVATTATRPLSGELFRVHERHYGRFPLPPSELDASSAAALSIVLLEHQRSLYVVLNGTHSAWHTAEGRGTLMCAGGWTLFTVVRGGRSTKFLVWERLDLAEECPSYIRLGPRAW